ncbi:glycosyltransferase family 2 protein [Mollicutes bacterium LVI A0078]|nr:glycosyltransferase family 2 protein [Mollicutes bacterium LVI A0075]WOO90867.1 glycosyltransferase family 2 protein [Mollicutes bacterium LVI A0078]
MTVILLTYSALNILLGSNVTIDLVSYDSSYTNLLSMFFPLLYLCLYKHEQTTLKQSLCNSVIGYIVVVCILMLIGNVVTVDDTNVMLPNTAFIHFVKDNTNLLLAILIYAVSISIEVLKIGIVCELAFGSIENNDNTSGISLILFIVLMLSAQYLVIEQFTNNLWMMKNVLQMFYIASNIIFLIVLSSYGMYLCFKQYMRPFQKSLLLIFGTFPIILCIFYLAYIKSPLYLVFNTTIHDLNVIFYLFSIIVLLFYTIETIVLLYAYRKRKYTNDISENGEAVNDLDIFVLIPCMNEGLVINKTLRSLCNNQYKNLNIYVIDDASSDNTLFEVAKCADIRKHVLKRCKPNAQDGKGEALNWAYYQLLTVINDRKLNYEEVLITIIDADTEVEPDYFEKVNKVFKSDTKITGLQSKVRVVELGADSAQDLEFAQIINSMQSLRNITDTVAFGGNGQFCRLSILEKLEEKPWSKSLVEDFDLSTRLYLKLGDQIHNVQYDDIYIKQSGIVNDVPALVKQRVRWAQGNVQSFKYFKQIIKSNKLKKIQKVELCATLIKPWLMAIEYSILIYTLILIVDVLLFEGFTRMLILVLVLFIAMCTYILFINFIWSILYNKEKNAKLKFTKTVSDTYYLTKFLFTLTQIYPQSILRHFKRDNTWDKTSRQQKPDTHQTGIT